MGWLSHSTGFGANYFGSLSPARGPSEGEEGHISGNVDSEMSQHLRRLSKRDPTTKLKALRALRELVEGKDPAEVAPVLPAWGYSFRRLAMDNNRYVCCNFTSLTPGGGIFHACLTLASKLWHS